MGRRRIKRSPKKAVTYGKLRTGSGVSVSRLILGELPRPLLTVQRYARRYRRLLEAACVEAHGGVDVVAAHTIDAAVGYETHIAICRWLLNNRWDKLEPKDILACSTAMASARSRRNQCLKQLNLDAVKDEDLVAAYFAQPAIEFSDEEPAADTAGEREPDTTNAVADVDARDVDDVDDVDDDTDDDVDTGSEQTEAEHHEGHAL